MSEFASGAPAEWRVGSVPVGADVHTYLMAQPLWYRQRLHDCMVASLQPGHATPAFYDQFYSPLAVAIPVEGSQEYDYVRHTLEQYAHQEDPPPHRILLHVNYDKADANSNTVRQTIGEIEEFLEENPHVPAAYFASTHPEGGTTIGALRRVTTDAVIVPMRNIQSLGDAMVINHDSDTLRLHPRYLRRMWDTFTRAPEPLAVVTSEIRHGRSSRFANGEQPNMDTVSAWLDYTVVAAGGFYDLGNGLSVRKYCEAQGYDMNSQQSETFELIGRMNQGRLRGRGIERAAGALLYTSPRRITSQLYMTGGKLASFWEQGDMTAGAEYREHPVFSLLDISERTRDSYVRFIAGSLVPLIAQQKRTQNPAIGYVEALELARRKMHIGRLLLGGPELGRRSWSV